MMLKTFIVPFTDDKRMEFAKEHLEYLGYESVNEIQKADFVLLPIPAKKAMFNGLENKIVFFGAGDFKGYDYNDNETFLIKNSYLTAEGAIALFKESCDRALYNSDVLLVGYGRIAKALHRILNAMGCRVTVCVRKQSAFAEAIYNNARVITFEELKIESNYNAVFNTVPHIVFTKNEIDALSGDTILIDLASFPGGVDTLYASSKGVKLIDGKKLPSRYSKETAGKFIAQAVDEMIKEELI
ncbi:MAG: hypothetical protein LIO62_06035 [Clostridiales bacterium]|nr:hypothetical protein [Clostridiales bacterium]